MKRRRLLLGERERAQGLAPADLWLRDVCTSGEEAAAAHKVAYSMR